MTCKRIFAICMILLCLTCTVHAASKIDLGAENASLTLHYRDGEKNLSGADFEAWRVAAVDAYARYILTEKFAKVNITNILDEEGYLIDQENDTWSKVGTSLESWIMENGLAVDAQAKTDDKGIAIFKNLPTGIYLVNGKQHSQDDRVYSSQPFLIAVPSVDMEVNEGDYSVEANIKHTSKSIPSESTESYKILKQWVIGEKDDFDEVPEQPKEITINVYNDNGKVVRTFKLKASDNWQKVLTLTAGEGYVFAETEVPGFSTTVEYTDEKAVTYVIITNTWNGLENPEKPEIPLNPTGPETPPVPDQPVLPELPKTGMLWWPVPVMSLLGMACFLAGWVRKERS